MPRAGSLRLGLALVGGAAASAASLSACNGLLDDFVYVDAGVASLGDAGLGPTTAPDATAPDATADAAFEAGPALDASSGDAAADGGFTYRAAVLAAAPLAYWRLGEIVGPSASSVTGDGMYTASYLDGITLGVAGAIDGDPDTAIHLDGNRAVVSWDGGFPAIDQQIFAVEMWFRPTGSGSFQILVNSVDPSTSVTLFYDEGSLLHGNDSNAAATANYKSTADPLVGAWNYLVLQCNGVELSMYLNLASVATIPVPPPDAPDADAGSDAAAPTFDIGGNQFGFNTFEGDLDEVAVYPTPLDLETMALHYQLAGPHDAGP